MTSEEELCDTEPEERLCASDPLDSLVEDESADRTSVWINSGPEDTWSQETLSEGLLDQTSEEAAELDYEEQSVDDMSVLCILK